MTVHSEKSEKSGVDAFKKWLGLVAAVLSLGSAAYGLLHAQADKQQRDHTASDKLESGRLQEKAGDYAQAWDSLQQAAKVAAADGVVSRLIGGLSKRQEEVHTEQQNLAMKWLQNAVASDDQGLAEIGNNAIKLLSADVSTTTGARKADILAHLGYAYYLKSRNDEAVGDPAAFYKQAVAVDPQNPYANAYWGHLLMFNHGSVEEAKQHFAAALASGREHELVRHYEISAFANNRADESEAAWWQVINEMHKAGETLDKEVMHEMRSKYYFAAGNDNDRKDLFAALPPGDHVELARVLLQPGNSGDDNAAPTKVILAEALEAAGKKDEALAAWQDVKAAVQGQNSSYEDRINAAVKRLGGAGKKH
jgi:hypothetical protein